MFLVLRNSASVLLEVDIESLWNNLSKITSECIFNKVSEHFKSDLNCFCIVFQCKKLGLYVDI